MTGKKFSKIRILSSIFKKYKKPYVREGFVIIEDWHIFVKEPRRSLYSFIRPSSSGWRKAERMKRKRAPYKALPKKFYSSTKRFAYEIKEDYELSIR